MTAEVTLEHLFTRTARAFGTRPCDMRSRCADPKARDARLAFCRLAILAGAGDLAVGMKLGRDAAFVRQAVWNAGARFDADRDFAARYQDVELECVVEAGVAARTLYPLPLDSDPRTIAERLVHSPREAMAVGTADLATIGAAFLAIDDEITLLRAEIAGLKKTPSKDVEHGQAA
ncbi:MAG: hypothetical protein QM651_15175 [Rhodoblastus sp.]